MRHTDCIQPFSASPELTCQTLRMKMQQELGAALGRSAPRVERCETSWLPLELHHFRGLASTFHLC